MTRIIATVAAALAVAAAGASAAQARFHDEPECRQNQQLASSTAYVVYWDGKVGGRTRDFVTTTRCPL